MTKKVLITGATGMIGSLVLQQCLESSEVGQVISLTRRPCGLSHEKLQEVCVENFEELDSEADYFKGIDIVYYCQGVYTGAVPRARFRQITVDYPEALARILIESSPDLTFCLLSGAGADRSEKSRVAFARDKGIIENRLAGLGFKCFHSFRPSYIYPVASRTEPNFSYRMMRYFYPLIKLFGDRASIKSTQLAKAMFDVGLGVEGPEIVENADIIKLASS